MVRRVVGSSLLLCVVLACGGGAPTPYIRYLDALPDACGGWRARLSVADVEGATVSLTADGAPVRTWTAVTGDQVLEAGGFGAPDVPVRLEARVGANSVLAEVTPVFTAAVRLAPDRAEFAHLAPPVLEIHVDGDCRTDGLSYRAQTPRWVGSGSLAATGPTLVTLPPQPDGVHALHVDVLRDTHALGSAVATFFVGDPEADGDGDGHPSRWGAGDCDDADADVHPEAPEKQLPNRIDDDCDGIVDEGTAAYDDDGDGTSEHDGDCDDGDPARRPGAEEVADCRDQDCDGRVDEGLALDEADDAFEANNTRAAARAVGPGELVFVSRDASDEEWFALDAAPTVTIDRLPDGSAYDVEIRDATGSVRGAGRIVRDHESVGVSTDGSGPYLVRIRPAKLARGWCPVAAHIAGG